MSRCFRERSVSFALALLLDVLACGASLVK